MFRVHHTLHLLGRYPRDLQSGYILALSEGIRMCRQGLEQDSSSDICKQILVLHIQQWGVLGKSLLKTSTPFVTQSSHSGSILGRPLPPRVVKPPSRTFTRCLPELCEGSGPASGPTPHKGQEPSQGFVTPRLQEPDPCQPSLKYR